MFNGLICGFDCAANADGKTMEFRFPMDNMLLEEVFAQLFQNIVHLGRGMDSIDPDEFLTAESCGEAAGVERILAQQPGNCDQGIVTGQMAIGIVVFFEFIDVHHGDDEVLAVLVDAVQEFVQAAPVWNARECIVLAQMI